ncbi:MAG: H-NS histone family protein [Candidatus Saccharibacteria bacterium]|nr:H-NS histone family protein [Pseudorhodobacter sp.]
MDINLNDVSLKELKDLQVQVSKAISSFEDHKKKDAIAELEEVARAKGFTLAELTGATIVRKRAPATAKFANPSDKSDTWSGRGRKPRWYEAALKNGMTPADLAI